MWHEGSSYSRGKGGAEVRGGSSRSLFLDGSTGRGSSYSRGKIGGEAGEVLSSTTNVAQFLVNILVALY